MITQDFLLDKLPYKKIRGIWSTLKISTQESQTRNLVKLVECEMIMEKNSKNTLFTIFYLEEGIVHEFSNPKTQQ